MKISIGRFDITLEAQDVIILPPFKGSTLRGAFGGAFRRVVCVMKGKECAACLLKGTCVYSYVFETPPPLDARIMRKYQAAPHPFIIEPPAGTKRIYQPGETLTFGLTLIGKALDYLPYFIYTFEDMGKTGLGKGRTRGQGRFILREVLSRPVQRDNAALAGQVVYSSATGTLSGICNNTLPLGPVVFADTADNAARISFDFLTPTRISYNERLTENIAFHVIIRSLLRRISLLRYFHDYGAELDYDFHTIIARAQEVTTVAKHLRRYNWERYSSRQEKKIPMPGFTGRITFEGNLTPFLPLIHAGEVLHIGKGTVFGLGRYRLEQVQGEKNG